MQDALLGADGSAHGRDPNAERDADHYGPGTGGKKRKVPAFTQALGRQDDEPSGSESDDGTQPAERQKSFPVSYRSPRSKAATACSFQKALFLRRKAALITLYIDAQNAISNGAAQAGLKGSTGIMDVPNFEKLLTALEDIGISDWPPDRPSWRSRLEDPPIPKSKTLEQWKTGFDQRWRNKNSHQPTVRGGWAPEGSFEFEMSSQASIVIRNKIRDQVALHKLVNDLRSITLSAKPPPKPNQVGSSLEKPPQKTQRISTRNPEPLAMKASPPMTRTPSKDSEPSTKGKSKKKKKKRSVMANQGNPHHVDNYRPSRKAAIYADPYEPYPHHSSLLFPPPMRLLSLGPQRRTAPLPGSHSSSGPVRAAEDDFICCFCEMDLFFGTEAARKRAIRRLKQERRRKESIRNKAKDVAEGKGKLKDEESDYDDDEEEWCGEDDGHGRCTCGRQLSEPHRSVKSRLKPPDTDPPHEHDHHDHHHELGSNDYDHHHDQGHVFDHVALHTDDGTVLEGVGFVQEDLD